MAAGFTLTHDYFASRYPDAGTASPADIYTAEIAEQRLGIARMIIAWVRERLESLHE